MTETMWSEEEKDRAHKRAEAAFVGVKEWDDAVRADCMRDGMTARLHLVADAMLEFSAELLAARGGTMTAEDLTDALEYLGRDAEHTVQHLRSHLAVLGARMAVLEKERDARRWVQCTTASNECLGGCRSMTEHDRYRHQQLMGELENLRPVVVLHEDMTRLKREAERERDAALAEVERLNTQRDAAEQREAQLRQALEIAEAEAQEQQAHATALDGRVVQLETNCSGLQAVLDAATDFVGTPLLNRCIELAQLEKLPEAERAERALAARLRRMDEKLQQLREGVIALTKTAVDLAKELGEPAPKVNRYPCSPTCTHDDAAKPGHQERVRLLSGTVAKVTGLDGTTTETGPVEAPICPRCGRRFPGARMPHGGEPCDVPPGHPERVKERSALLVDVIDAAKDLRKREAGLQRAYDNGAEAMRAACWEAVQGQMRRMGWVASERAWRELKAAIEGAAP